MAAKSEFERNHNAKSMRKLGAFERLKATIIQMVYPYCRHLLECASPESNFTFYHVFTPVTSINVLYCRTSLPPAPRGKKKHAVPVSPRYMSYWPYTLRQAHTRGMLSGTRLQAQASKKTTTKTKNKQMTPLPPKKCGEDQIWSL